MKLNEKEAVMIKTEEDAKEMGSVINNQRLNLSLSLQDMDLEGSIILNHGIKGSGYFGSFKPFHNFL